MNEKCIGIVLKIQILIFRFHFLGLPMRCGIDDAIRNVLVIYLIRDCQILDDLRTVFRVVDDRMMGNEFCFGKKNCFIDFYIEDFGCLLKNVPFSLTLLFDTFATWIALRSCPVFPGMWTRTRSRITTTARRPKTNRYFD